MIKSDVPRTLIGFFSLVNVGMLSLEKVLLYQFIKYLRNQGKNIKKTLVLGTGDVAKAFVDSVKWLFVIGYSLIVEQKRDILHL